MSHSIYANPSAIGYQCSEEVSLPTTPHAFHPTFFSNYSPTPLTALPMLARELGVKDVLLKYEGDRFGLPAFKILGASWAIGVVLARRLRIDVKGLELEVLKGRLESEDFKPILFSATDGNHGRAVAYIARLLGLQSMIYVPEFVSETSQAAIRSEGAEVVVTRGDYDYAVKLCAEDASISGDCSPLIQDTAWEGYDEIPNLIVQGYTTIFHEVDSQLDILELGAPSMVVVPVGVGSLAHSALKHYRTPDPNSPHPSTLTVEPTLAGCLNASLHAGRSVVVQTKPNTMPGLTCGTVSASALDDLLGGVDLSVLVSDEEVGGAVQDLDESGVKAGPCGAASLAGVRGLKKAGRLNANMVVVLVCTEGLSSDSVC